MRGFCRWWFSNPPEHEIGTISHLEAESKWPPSGLVEWSLMDSHVLRHVNCHYVVSVWDYKAAIIKWILRGPIAYASTCFCFMMWLSIIFDLWFRRHFNKVIVLHIHNKLLRFVWEWWVMYLGSNEGNGEQVCCRWGHQEGIHRAGGGRQESAMTGDFKTWNWAAPSETNWCSCVCLDKSFDLSTLKLLHSQNFTACQSMSTFLHFVKWFFTPLSPTLVCTVLWSCCVCMCVCLWLVSGEFDSLSECRLSRELIGSCLEAGSFKGRLCPVPVGCPLSVRQPVCRFLC